MKKILTLFLAAALLFGCSDNKKIDVAGAGRYGIQQGW